MFKREGIELSVIKTEGLNQNPNDLGCDIYINDDFIDTISPLNSTQDELITDIPLSGSLGLVIKNSLTSAKISSVSLALDLFQNSGHFWLPLFKDQMNDQISQLPSDKKFPRVLIQIIRQKELSPVPEITETSCEEFGDADKMPEVKFLNTSLASSPASEKGQTENVMFNIEKVLQQNNQQDLNLWQKRLKFELLSRKNLEEKIKQLNQKYETQSWKVQERENDFVKQLNQKESEIFSIQQTHLTIKQECNRLTLENSRLKDQLHWYMAEDWEGQIQILKDENNELKIQLDSITDKISYREGYSDKSPRVVERDSTFQQNLSDQLQQRNNELQKKLKECKKNLVFQQNENQDKSKQINDLKMQLQQLKQTKFVLENEIEGLKEQITEKFSTQTTDITSFNEKSTSEQTPTNNIDTALNNYLGPKIVQKWFKQISPGVYNVGGKKVKIVIKNSKILVNTFSNNFIPVSDYLKQNIITDIDAQPPALNLLSFPSPNHKNSRTFSPLHRRTNTMPEIFNSNTIGNYETFIQGTDRSEDNDQEKQLKQNKKRVFSQISNIKKRGKKFTKIPLREKYARNSVSAEKRRPLPFK